MRNAISLLALAVCLSQSPEAAAFAPAIGKVSPSAPAITHQQVTSTPRASTALAAGFGGGASKKGSKKAKIPKLNAKAQWDRFADLKGCEKIVVGVRLRGEDEWLKVGKVRSEGDGNTNAAVARQRALIAEHSKRIYPVKIPANAVLEWGRMDGEEWVLVDKASGDEAAKGIEKKVGFEGIADKATGFYCYYHEGRIVEREATEGKGGAAGFGGGGAGAAFSAVKGK
ncbi:hypothetical protein ACHAXT_008866 [Thalassiosira profunda]